VGDLFLGAPGATIEPGGTYRVTLTGEISSAEAESITLAGHLIANDLPNVGDFSVTTSITRTFGHAGGIVFGDQNNNGKFDQGEELAGVTLTWNYRFTQPMYTATTDSSGRFTFPQVPTVSYYATATAPDGWVIMSRQIEIDSSDRADNLQVRAVHPLPPDEVRVGQREVPVHDPGARRCAFGVGLVDQSALVREQPDQVVQAVAAAANLVHQVGRGQFVHPGLYLSSRDTTGCGDEMRAERRPWV
jgi:hypothetical protein